MKKSARELRQAKQRLAHLDNYQFDADNERATLERKIASLEAEPGVSEKIKVLGSGMIPSGRFKLLVKRGTVVTVLTEEMESC